MKSWSEHVASTWLGDQDRRGALAALADELQLAAGGYGSMRPLDSFHDDILVLGENHRWQWASTALSLSAEYLLCAESGGILSAKTTHSDGETISTIPLIEQLRNTLCHPAHVGHVDALATLLEARGSSSEASQLRASPRDLNQRWLAELALYSVDVIGTGTLRRFSKKLSAKPSSAASHASPTFVATSTKKSGKKQKGR